jgi:hypothetical protein
VSGLPVRLKLSGKGCLVQTVQAVSDSVIITVNSRWRRKQVSVEVTITRVTFAGGARFRRH